MVKMEESDMRKYAAMGLAAVLAAASFPAAVLADEAFV